MPALTDSPELKYLYLTTVGRKTGLLREIEIWFVEYQGRYYILAEMFDRAQWVKNIVNNPRVRVRVGDRGFEATARVLAKKRDSKTWRAAQQLARAKYEWGEGLPVEITPDPAGAASQTPARGPKSKRGT
jgi:deazaflavin-dependent oxidoreductase (nitroreductase family)